MEINETNIVQVTEAFTKQATFYLGMCLEEFGIDIKEVNTIDPLRIDFPEDGKIYAGYYIVNLGQDIVFYMVVYIIEQHKWIVKGFNYDYSASFANEPFIV